MIFLTPLVAQDALALTPISNTERKRSHLLEDKTVADIFKKHIDAMEDTGAPTEPNVPQ